MGTFVASEAAGAVFPRALAAAVRLRRGIAAAARWMNAAAGWMFVACALFITLDVIGRNTIGRSSQSTTEITGYMLAFGIAWGLPHALADRAHVRIDVFLNRLPSTWRQYLHLLALALLAVLIGFLVWGALATVTDSWEFGATDISYLRTPLVVPQSLWAFGLIMLLALILALWFEAGLRLIAGDGGAIDDLLGPRSYREEAAEAIDAAHSPEKGAR